MNDPDFQDRPDEDGLMGEASVWFGRMRGPEAEMHKAEFEAWLARGALHRAFYNRASEIYAMGKFLKEERENGDVDDHTPTRRRRRKFVTIAAVLAFTLTGLSAAWVYGTSRDSWQTIATGDKAMRLYTREGQVLAQVLSDGSKVTLQPRSVLVVRYSATERVLRLEQGESRFEVAHEKRPFVVLAAQGSITARGTIFDVAIGRREHVTVRLLQGKIDVAVPGTAKMPKIRRLVTGETVSYGGPISEPKALLPKVQDGSAPMTPTAQPGVREFAAVPLGEIVTLANHHSPAIRMADGELSALRVSGRFRLDEPEKLAAKLAAIFDLVSEHAANGDILLRKRRNNFSEAP